MATFKRQTANQIEFNDILTDLYICLKKFNAIMREKEEIILSIFIFFLFNIGLM